MTTPAKPKIDTRLSRAEYVKASNSLGQGSLIQVIIHALNSQAFVLEAIDAFNANQSPPAVQQAETEEQRAERLYAAAGPLRAWKSVDVSDWLRDFVKRLISLAQSEATEPLKQRIENHEQSIVGLKKCNMVLTQAISNRDSELSITNQTISTLRSQLAGAEQMEKRISESCQRISNKRDADQQEIVSLKARLAEAEQQKCRPVTVKEGGQVKAIIAKNGDTWLVRDCTDDENCVVLQRTGIEPDAESEDTHIPRDVWKQLIRQEPKP